LIIAAHHLLRRVKERRSLSFFVPLSFEGEGFILKGTQGGEVEKKLYLYPLTNCLS
jgi:hypothetical protein